MDKYFNALQALGKPEDSTGFDTTWAMDLEPYQRSIDEQNRYEREKNRQQARNQEFRSRPEDIWPSYGWFEDHGITSPDILSRYSQAQSAVLGLVNGLGLGLPNAVLEYISPDTAKQVNAITDNNSTAALVGEVAGFIGSPATAIYRMAGDKLRERGAGVGASALADALTAGGVYSAPSLMRGDGLPLSLEEVMLAAAGTRMVAPDLPKTVLGRMGAGAAGGAFASLPFAYDDPMEVPKTAVIGAIHGAALRGKQANHKTPFESDYTPGFWTAAPLAIQTLDSIGDLALSEQDDGIAPIHKAGRPQLYSGGLPYPLNLLYPRDEDDNY